MKKSSKTPRGIANGSISKLYRPTAPPMIAPEKLHRLTNKARGAASVPVGSCSFNKIYRQGAKKKPPENPLGMTFK